MSILISLAAASIRTVSIAFSIDATGEKIETNYGFTATHVTPAILFGSVSGEVMSVSPDYVARSVAHFTLTLSDAEYERAMAVVTAWREAKQPSYNLNKRNCVFFVAQIAETLGMTVDTSRLMKKPFSFLTAMTSANQPWLAARGSAPAAVEATAHKPPA